MADPKIQPYWNEDHTKYPILVSSGPVGWSISNGLELAYDSQVVKYVLDHLKDDNWRKAFRRYDPNFQLTRERFHERSEVRYFEEFLRSIGYDSMYLYPIADIEVVWIPAGRKWRIYDGGEFQDILEFEDGVKWTSFQ